MFFLEDNRLEIRFPEVNRAAGTTLEFHCTLRIPDDGRAYPLPPGLGCFPLHTVDELGDRAPAAWTEEEGIFFPMYQAEALWLNFLGGYPVALKIATGKICALTGQPWSPDLVSEPQNYVVIPDQLWLDGFCVGQGLIRQFVAMPLGDGYSAEEQLTGLAQHGGLQFVAYPMKDEVFEKLHPGAGEGEYFPQMRIMSPPSDMGLAPGGLMHQDIYEDEYGLEVWDQSAGISCFVHVLNSLQYQAVTGNVPPSEPLSAAAYTHFGLPWFEYYNHDLKALEGSPTLAELDSVAARKTKQDQGPLEDNEAVRPDNIVTLQGDKGQRT